MLSWRSHGINEFIVQAMSLVREANTILSGLKGNVAQIEACLTQMREEVMFERKDAKTFLAKLNSAEKEAAKIAKDTTPLKAAHGTVVVTCESVVKLDRSTCGWCCEIIFAF